MLLYRIPPSNSGDLQNGNEDRICIPPLVSANIVQLIFFLKFVLYTHLCGLTTARTQFYTRTCNLSTQLFPPRHTPTVCELLTCNRAVRTSTAKPEMKSLLPYHTHPQDQGESSAKLYTNQVLAIRLGFFTSQHEVPFTAIITSHLQDVALS
eukprot:TRINITY_DN14858_c0_g2_i2.p1 TRINITY_DN14858_c0_g2~~TRINITY_DN14858_c0_g2_i2.p1  ORF type:complete len:152 (+),score=7.00 TRINITY_DN14858_c0_g2_i2:296-751(+)